MLFTKQDVEKLARKLRQRTCPHCSNEYTLGINGVEDGCDECEGIVRNPLDGTIIRDDYSNLFSGEQS
jgi:hypothetical protein